MQSFQEYLAESAEIEKLTHLQHLEDHIFQSGHEGVGYAASVLKDIHSLLLGGKSKTKVTAKFDGAPSLVFGINPENNKFFVGTKSVFNKTKPKLNYTERDIDYNHADSPGLALKLTQALRELRKIMPKKGGVFQGDLLYDKSSIVQGDKDYSFTPNTITYSTKKDSEQGNQIKNAVIGIVIHTKYIGKTLQDMKASFDVNYSSFRQTPNVHIINPEVQSPGISTMEKNQYEGHIKFAEDLYKTLDNDIFNVVDGHKNIDEYINFSVKEGSKVSVDGYKKFIKMKYKDHSDKLKTEVGKSKKAEQEELILGHIDNHKKQFRDIFQLHQHLENAKNILVGALSRSETGFNTTIGGKQSKPEGFVVTRGNQTSKMIDRAEFSKMNFAIGAFNTKNDPQKPIVFSYGRMNPPTLGHKAVSDKVKEVAGQYKADYEIVLTRSRDPEKNPLQPLDKLNHAKKSFGHNKIRVSEEGEDSIIIQAKNYAKAGYDHLILVVGGDRVEHMKKLLESRNGTDYNFKKIDVISAGLRDTDSENDIESVSGTKTRHLAITNNYKDFEKCFPRTMTPEDIQKIFLDVQQGMQIEINDKTSHASLLKHAKRKDPIGSKARRELKKREKNGNTNN